MLALLTAVGVFRCHQRLVSWRTPWQYCTRLVLLLKTPSCPVRTSQPQGLCVGVVPRAPVSLWSESTNARRRLVRTVNRPRDLYHSTPSPGQTCPQLRLRRSPVQARPFHDLSTLPRQRSVCSILGPNAHFLWLPSALCTQDRGMGGLTHLFECASHRWLGRTAPGCAPRVVFESHNAEPDQIRSGVPSIS